MNDLDIYSRYRAGDKSVLRDVYKQYDPLINSTIMQYKDTGIDPIALDAETKRIIAKSLKSYDPGKGNFTVHLQNNLKSMYRATNNSQMLRIPDARASLLRRYRETYDEMNEALKREPSYAEMADRMNIGIKDIKKLVKETGVSVVPSKWTMDMEDEAEGQAETPEDVIKDLRQAVNDPVDQQIVDGSFGTGSPSTNAQIAKMTGLTEGAIRSRKNRIIKMIRERY